MIDYGPGLPDGWRTRLRTGAYFLQNLPHWLRYDILQAGWAPLARRVWLKLASIGERMASIGPAGTTQTAERSVAEMFDHQELPDAYRRIAVDYLDAFYRYEPAIYDGQVLLFWARCRPLFHSLAPALGWNHFAADGFKRIVVPCNHGNIMMSPHVGAIAAGLERAIGHGSARRG
jgi:thioesterase domain-containing protein